MHVRIEELSPVIACSLIANNRVLTQNELSMLHECIQWTERVWVGFIDEVPVAAWGLAPTTLISDRAYLWLWTPKDLEYQVTFIRWSKRAVEAMLEYYPVIFGVTDPTNVRAQRWLRWLGARYTVVRADGLLAFEIHKDDQWQTLSA